MKLLTKTLRQKLIENGRAQAEVKGTKAENDFWPVVKLFYPAGAATWLLTELDPEDTDIARGLCDLGTGFPEFGAVSLTQLQNFRGVFGLGIERDLHFEARAPISRYIDAARAVGYIVDEVTP